jgi:CRP-like cAMP-binding protein
VPIVLSNSLLDKLGPAVGDLTEKIFLEPATDLSSSDQTGFVYFPLSALISIVYGDGLAEGATIGNDGMLGCTTLLGVDEPVGKSIVVISGMAARIAVSHVRRVMEQDPGVVQIVHQYTYDLIAQILKLAACAHSHTIEQRCARWLLHADNCVGAKNLAITQQHLAELLGVQRATINPALTHLRAAGVIDYSRGKLFVRNRQKLATAACQCSDLAATDPVNVTRLSNAKRAAT